MANTYRIRTNGNSNYFDRMFYKFQLLSTAFIHSRIEKADSHNCQDFKFQWYKRLKNVTAINAKVCHWERLKLFILIDGVPCILQN